MKIIIGLGNIGKEYEKTRHNAGFMVIDQLAKDLGLTWKEDSKLHTLIAKGSDILLAKPTTLMNLSGHAASAVIHFYKAPISDLTVIYDDVDLPLGTIRVRDKGSAGTHNGMKSIIQELGTSEFKRIRIGIESRGELAPAKMDTSSFVLSAFTKEESALLNTSIKSAITELEKSISA